MSNPAMRQRGIRTRRSITLPLVAVALLSPEVLLARHEPAQFGTPLTLISDIAVGVAGVILGLLLASRLLRARPRTGRMIGRSALITISIGIVTIIVANFAPPPFITNAPPMGTPTVNGALNAVYVAGIVASCTATIRLVIASLQLLARRSQQ